LYEGWKGKESGVLGEGKGCVVCGLRA